MFIFNHFYQCPVFGKLRPITCLDWLRTTLTVFAGKFCVNPYVACVYLPAHLGEINGQIDLNNRWKMVYSRTLAISQWSRSRDH